MKTPLLALIFALTPCFSLAQFTLEEKDCIAHLKDDPRLEILKEKIALGPVADQTFLMRQNLSKPIHEEKMAIAQWMDARNNCQKMGQYFRDQMIPSLRFIAEEQQADFDKLADSLFGGEITFGEFAKRRSDSAVAFQKNWASELTKFENQRAESSSVEQAGKPPTAQPKNWLKAFADGMAEARKNQPKTIYTDCLGGNGAYSCTSRER